MLANTAPTSAQQASYYNRAQKALSQLYAARVNQLYLNTIGFIVSDVPSRRPGLPNGRDRQLDH